MVIAAVGVFTAVLFQKVRAGMGVTFAFVFVEFFLYAFGGARAKRQLSRCGHLYILEEEARLSNNSGTYSLNQHLRR